MEIGNKKRSPYQLFELEDYMFTSKNLIRFTKHMIRHNKSQNNNNNDNITNRSKNNNIIKKNDNTIKKNDNKENNKKNVNQNIYRPLQNDSLFWCFYILKHGYFNYEMEINNKYFVVEKSEKFKYINMIRNNKDLLKIHKIKPFTELEDDLANKDKISIKTFLALCILENINILLVDKRKIIELISVDIDLQHPINIIHRNSKTGEHHIELNGSNENLQNYRDNYYKMTSFDSNLKSMSSYKMEELLELCKKLNININIDGNKDTEPQCKKKKTKKDIYELLILNY